MVSAISGIALSGLQAAAKRLENSANNIANQHTTDEATGRAFEPRDIVQISEEAGGVRTESIMRDPATVAFPGIDSETGVVKAPSVDTAEELITQQSTLYDAEANRAILEAQDKREQDLLNIIV